MSRSAGIVFAVIAVALVAVGLFIATAPPDEQPARAAGTSSRPPVSDASEAAPDATSPALPSTAPPTSAPQTSRPPLSPGAEVCDGFGSINVVGTVQSDALIEISGIAAGRTSDGVVWAHNDSRSGPLIHAIGEDGTDLGATEIGRAFSFDWEDMAAGPGPDEAVSYLYVGDIGDNLAIRGGQITVYRVAEPQPGIVSVPADVLGLAYPEGEALNAEALFVDPIDLGLYIITRNREVARVYRADAAAADGGEQTLEFIAALPLGAGVTGADITPDGRVIALRGERNVWMWYRPDGTTVAEALDGAWCNAPSPDERQGESIAFIADGAYLTISEGSHPPIHRVDQSS